MDETLNKIKKLTHPTMFLLHPRIISNQQLMELILCQESIPDFYKYQTLKSSLWNSSSCLEMIGSKLIIKKVCRQNFGDHPDPSQNFLSVSSIIDLESEQLRMALGALLVFMQTSSINMDEGVITVSSVETLTLTAYLSVDASSMR